MNIVCLVLAPFDRGEIFVFSIISGMYELSEYFWLSWILLFIFFFPSVVAILLLLLLQFWCFFCQVYIIQLQVKHTIGRKWEPEYFHSIALQPITLADVDEWLQEGAGRLGITLNSAAVDFQQFLLPSLTHQ